jgi:uncharacterized protein YndB with AHSA1/START domain
MPKAELARFIDRWTVEYVRTYPHPIQRVWRAITDPAEISAWFWTASFDLRVGGEFRFGPEDGDMHGVFEIVDPPRLVRFKGPFPETNPQGYMQFTLTDVPAGTRMTFVQHFTPGLVPHPELSADPADHPAADVNPWRAGTLAGWHLAFEALRDQLDGIRPKHVALEESEWLPLYRRHMLQYQP